MGRPTVFVSDFINDGLEPERAALDGVADVAALDAKHEDDLAGRIEDAAAIMMYHAIVMTDATLGRLRDCKLIVRCGVGFDNVDHAAARRRGIPVANIPDYGSEEVADSAIGMALSLCRGVTFWNSRLRRGVEPWAYTQAWPIQRLRGRLFGVVGLGRIGSAAALRAKALGMTVGFYDPYKPDGYDKALGVRRFERLDDLLAESHILSLHCPLTDETERMIDAAAMARMPQQSFLVNTARGAIVDTAAVPEAIASGQLAGAGIDVLPTEPPSADDPLIRAWRDSDHPCHDRVLINPHSAFYSEQGLLDMRTKGAEACRRAILGEPLRNIVNE